MADKKKEQPWYIVRRSSIHSRGIFARRDIPKETRILEYTGERVTKAESLRRANARYERSKKTGCAAVYIFDINKRYDIDGSIHGNVARLINHSCDPNCEAFIIRGRVWIYSLREIKEGEELTYNYGFDLEHWADHPCRCGNDNCVGFIVDSKHWKKLAKLVEKVKKSRQAFLNGTATEGEHADILHAHTKEPSAAKKKKPAAAKKKKQPSSKKKTAAR